MVLRPVPVGCSTMAQSPNIVLILIDDLGAVDLGCFGSSFYETPNLDRLAERGVRFTNAYAASPVCSPTRAALMTGQHPTRVGITQYIGGDAHGRLASVPYLHYLPTEHQNLANTLHAAGYATWHVGKWHLGDGPCEPDRQGFDVNIGGNHYGMPVNGYFAPWQLPNLSDEGVADGTYLTDHLTDRAIALIEARDAEQPFFLNLSHYAVHAPIQAPAAEIERFTAKAKRLRLDQVEAVVEGEHFACAHKADRRIQRRVIQSDPAYAAMVANLDANLGRVFDCLDDQGISDDTIVVFTSDNGGLATAEGSPTCNLPWAEGKGWGYEGGTRVCQLIAWPGQLAAGQICTEPTVTMDLYPTLLSAAGLSALPEQHCDGCDLWPVLTTGQPGPDRALYWHYPHYSNQGDTPMVSILADGWKLIRHFEDGQQELYHLVGDPSEDRDLAAQEGARVEALSARLDAWIAELNASVPPEHANPGVLPPRVIRGDPTV